MIQRLSTSPTLAATVTQTPCWLCEARVGRVLADDIADYEYGAPGSYRWVECENCRLIRIDPMPSPAILSLAYPDDYHAYSTPKSRLTQWLLSLSRDRLASRLVKEVPTHGSVLDLGCGKGELLAAMKRKKPLRVVGVECNPRAAEHARQLGVDVIEAMVEDVKLSQNQFDLILLQHVLEHVYDPKATLALCHDSLKPGGRLVGEIPNYASWDARLFGRYWGGGHAPRHLWFFTPTTLRRALESAGLVVETVTGALHTGHWALSLQNRWRAFRGQTGRVPGGRNAMYPALLLATVPINAFQLWRCQTGVMRFEARRP